MGKCIDLNKEYLKLIVFVGIIIYNNYIKSSIARA